ncbi:MAG: ATP-binding protein, partial [Kiritimatiellae bacterium]|nr:ATP-binding protein [Kiritimatiellia bacterium]
MSMETNLKGRLRNTSLPKSHGLMPLFEAVVITIHSIEELGLNSEEGRISVEIVRQPQGQLNLQDGKKTPGREALENIMGFK